MSCRRAWKPAPRTQNGSAKAAEIFLSSGLAWELGKDRIRVNTVSPGSTLFLVWQQRRSGGDAGGNVDFRDDVGAIFREKPENVFVMKVSYWLNP